MRECGLTGKLRQGKPILGFTDTETVKLDFDETTLKNVKYWADRGLNWFKLGGFIILRSSKDCYHVVFNKSVSWGKNMSIVAWVALQSQNRGLIKWWLMQCIKRASTLRISNKKQKPSPRIVYRYGKQDNQMRGFLEYRKLIKRLTRKLKTIKQPKTQSLT
jgi:hypothetical protein